MSNSIKEEYKNNPTVLIAPLFDKQYLSAFSN